MKGQVMYYLGALKPYKLVISQLNGTTNSPKPKSGYLLRFPNPHFE